MAKHTKNKPTGNYSVGYAQPPKASQFKPGQSGNPSGRKKARKGIRDYEEEALRRKYRAMTPSGPESIPGDKAIIMKMLQMALQGDRFALKYFLEQMKAIPQGTEALIQELQGDILELKKALAESQKKEHTGAVVAIPQFSMTMEEWYEMVDKKASIPELDPAVLKGEKKWEPPK